MTHLWLITNSMSSTTNASVIKGVCAHIEAQGGILSRQIDLAREELPALQNDAPDIIASLGGDGTANAVINAYSEESTPPLLILPGGTMNLLAAKLHSEASIEQVIEDGLATAQNQGSICTLPQVNGPDFRSLVGVIAGPTAHWGAVREDIRQGEVGALVEDISTALQETSSGARVRLRKQGEEFVALFIEPHDDGLYAHDIVAENIIDLAHHGWAWLNRDFLGGPTEKLKRAHEIHIDCDEERIQLLVDGEQMSAPSPLCLCLSQCPIRFIKTAK